MSLSFGVWVLFLFCLHTEVQSRTLLGLGRIKDNIYKVPSIVLGSWQELNKRF